MLRAILTFSTISVNWPDKEVDISSTWSNRFFSSDYNQADYILTVICLNNTLRLMNDLKAICCMYRLVVAMGCLAVSSSIEIFGYLFH